MLTERYLQDPPSSWAYDPVVKKLQSKHCWNQASQKRFGMAAVAALKICREGERKGKKEREKRGEGKERGEKENKGTEEQGTKMWCGCKATPSNC